MQNKFPIIRKLFGIFLTLGIITVAIIILWRHTRNISLSAILQSIELIPPQKLLLALAATAISFTGMAAAEVIAAGSAQNKKLPWRIPVLAGTVGNALSNTLGLHTLTITAWRYKVYARAGLSLTDIATITALTFTGIVLGFSGVSVMSLAVASSPQAYAGYVILFIFLGALGVFFLWIGPAPRKVKFKKWFVQLPGFKAGLGLSLVTFIDISAAIYCAYVLLPADIAPGYMHFALFYIGIVVVGIISHTPGGIGVFEAGMMTSLAAKGRADVLAALLLYRVIYNLLPFACACIAAAWYLPRPSQLDKG